MTLLLGLDVGTTSCKAAVFSAEGDELAHGRAATPWRRVPTGAEADPHALLATAVVGAAVGERPAGHHRGVPVEVLAVGPHEHHQLRGVRPAPAAPSPSISCDSRSTPAC